MYVQPIKSTVRRSIIFPLIFPCSKDVSPFTKSYRVGMTPISDIREFSRLPLNARRYVKRLEELCGCPAKIISVGAAREQTIFRGEIY